MYVYFSVECEKRRLRRMERALAWVTHNEPFTEPWLAGLGEYQKALGISDKAAAHQAGLSLARWRELKGGWEDAKPQEYAGLKRLKVAFDRSLEMHRLAVESPRGC